MKNRSRLLLVGSATLLIGLISLFPARVAYRWFAPEPLAASDIDGTLWNGSAAAVAYKGLTLQDVRWRLRPQALLGAKLGYSVQARVPPGFIEGKLAVGLGASFTATDVNGSLPLAALQQLLQRPGLDGTVNLQLSELRVEDGLPQTASGTIEAAQLALPWVFRGSLGGYRAELFTQQDGIAASVEDTDGVVDLAGSLTLMQDGTYSFVGQLAPKAATPPAVRQQLQFLGTPDQRGQVELRIEGSL